MICKQCNSEIGNQKFCSYCGAPATQDNMQATSAQASESTEVKFSYAQEDASVATQPNAYESPVLQYGAYNYPQSDIPTQQDGYGAYPNTPQFNPQYAQPQFGQPQYAQPPYGQPMYDRGQYAPQPYTQPQQGDYPQSYAPHQCYQPNQYQPNPYQQQTPSQAQNVGNASPVDQGASKATAAMVWGIVSLFFGCIPAVIALIMAGKYKKVGNGINSKKATAGKVMAIIGIVLNVLAGLGVFFAIQALLPILQNIDIAGLLSAFA